jgi:hypothetical protein
MSSLWPDGTAENLQIRQSCARWATSAASCAHQYQQALCYLREECWIRPLDLQTQVPYISCPAGNDWTDQVWIRINSATAARGPSTTHLKLHTYMREPRGWKLLWKPQGSHGVLHSLPTVSVWTSSILNPLNPPPLPEVFSSLIKEWGWNLLAACLWP